MNRYFYYLLIVSIVSHIVTTVPVILFASKDKGALISIVIAIVVGTIFIYMITHFFNTFPGKGLPEILQDYIPKWFSNILLICMSLIWYAAGFSMLITNAFLMKRFLTPHMPFIWIVVILLVFISFGIVMKTKSVLYTVEMILMICLPVILFIIGKLYTNNGLKWDYVGKAVMHFYDSPNYSAFAASLFIFLGLANLAIFNREFTKRQQLTAIQLLLIGVFGAFALFTSYFIPIGYNGFNNINHLTYPWLLTADSIKIGFAFIERVMFVFLILYISISFLSIVITWHVGLELLRSTGLLRPIKWKEYHLTTYLFLLLLWIGSLWLSAQLSGHQINLYTKYLVNATFPFFVILLMVCWYTYRRTRT